MSLLPLTVCAQTTTLSGLVIDAATGKNMPFANVYVNGSTRGTVTDEHGRYTLTGVPLGTVEIVASFVGYQPERRTFRLESSQENRANFRLKPSEQNLMGVTVHGNYKKWERHLRQFKRQLLGEPFGGQCQLLNPDVLSFSEDNGHLKATASEPLQIENQALGYKLTYELRHFDGTLREVFYAGDIHFDELKPADERQARRMRRNRMIAYKGSTRHLMASLINGNYEQEGFLVYQENPKMPPRKNMANRLVMTASIGSDSIPGHLMPLKLRQLIQPGRLPFERKLFTDRTLIVFNMNATSSYSPYIDARYAYSEIRIPTGVIEMTTDGTITMPNGMVVYGSLSDDRLSRMLPVDWQVSPNEGASGSVPIVAQGKLLPPDARQDRIAKAYTERFKTLAPVLFAHTDKALYATGDQIWLSTYLLDAGTSKRPLGETAIHVDLLHPNGQLVQHQWLKVADGRATGNFRLSDTLASGTYRLRAYTDEDDQQHRPAFERSIAVYNLFQSDAPVLPDTTHGRLDLQVLPEGGRWVVGVPARLGIRVVAADGRGVVATGRILNEAGGEVARFTTNGVGIGSLVLTPDAGQNYRAQAVAVRNNRKQLLTGYTLLTPPEAEGITLSADVTSDTSQLALTISSTNRTAIDSAYLLIQYQGRLVDQRKILLQNGLARVSLPTSPLPAGVNQLTLYDATARPRAERLVFMPEQIPPVRVIMDLNKPRYQPREPAIVNLHLNDDGLPALAALSASITDAGQVPADTAEATIRTHLLLTGELRGRVEQPNNYLNDTSLDTRRALDDLLLTQGWRRVSGTPNTELLGGVSLIGRVLDPKNQPIPGAQVVIASTRQDLSFVKSAGTDERGRFRLAGLPIADTLQLLAQLTDHELKNFPDKEARLVLESPGIGWNKDTVALLSDWATVRAQLQSARLRQENDSDFYRDKTVKVLKEVQVKARKRDERPDDIRSMSLHGDADAIIVFDEKSTRFSNLYEMMRGRVPGVSVTQQSDPNKPAGLSYKVVVRGVGTMYGGSQPLYLLDGMSIRDDDGTALLNFNPGDIERIEVLKNGPTAGMYGVRGGNGVIAFYSKRFRTNQSGDGPKPNSKVLEVIGYPSVQREFYVPRYDTVPPELGAHIDRRDVLYWKPLMQTDSQGHSQLSFPLSDVVRQVRIVIQGVTAEGRPVVATKVIQVQ